MIEKRIQLYLKSIANWIVYSSSYTYTFCGEFPWSQNKICL